MSKAFVGNRVQNVDIGEELDKVTRVVLVVDSDHVYTAGDGTGRTIEREIPWGSQEMADSLLRKLSGVVYKPFNAERAMISPAFEIGDPVTVGGVYSRIIGADINYGISGLVDLYAPDLDITEDEYPSEKTQQGSIQRQLASTRSLISKTSEEIRLEVSNEIEGISAAIELDMTQIIGRVEDNEEGLSQTVRLAANGVTITNASGSVLEIDGGQLKAESIETSAFKANSITADKLNITGAITFGDLDEDTQLAISDAYTMAFENQLPSYIQNTYIDSVSIRSPTIVGGTFIGNEFNAIAEQYGNGSFNMYGKYGDGYVHALSISYAAGISPDVTIDTPSGGSLYVGCGMYVGGSIDVGLNDVLYNTGPGVVVSLRELDARVTALEAK